MTTNGGPRPGAGRPPGPWPLAHRKRQEWAEKAHDVRDTLRREELADEIFNCLNDKWDTLKLFGDIEDFTDIVLKQAREWCSDCYQDHSYC